MDKSSFRNQIIEFYHEDGRDFPWRETDNDLHALVAEIMLQQTSFYQVEPKYEEFSERFRTPQEVLEESEDGLKRYFEGLGLENRVKYVKAVAEFLASDKDIIQENLLEVKGVGRYTANAFLSTHKEERLPIVDGNVKRVFDKHFDTEGFSEEDYWGLAWEILPEENYRDYNLGLIDYGASLYEGNPDDR